VVSIDNLANEIAKQLRQFTEHVEEEVEVAKNEVAGTLMARLVVTSPTSTRAHKKYKNGWRIKKVNNKLIVHNQTKYQLTHLLEHGHAKVGGGRVPARVHIKPAEEEAIEMYINRVQRAIQG
jgi:hypothetical protein